MGETQQNKNTPFSSSLRQFFSKSSAAIFATALLFLLYFMPYLANSAVGVDSHLSIGTPGTTYNWLDIGRQGGILLNKLFLRSQFSMFYVEAATYLLYILSLIFFIYLFDRLAGISPWKTGLFFLLFMVHPIWTEQFYFTMMIFPIAFGVAILPVALYFAYSKKPLLWGLTIPLLVLIFSIYQTFNILYIAGCILCFLLLYIHQVCSGQSPSSRDLIRQGVRQILLFAVPFLINSLITKAFFSSSDYLTGQIRWGQDSIATCFSNILNHILQVLTASGVFYTPGFPLSVLAVGIGVLLFFHEYRQATGKWVVLLAILLLQATPFLLTIYGGNIPAYRSQFILPFTTGCNMLLFLALAVPPLAQKRWANVPAGAALVLGVLILAVQYYPSSLLQYSTALVQRSDLQLAYAIEERLIQTTGGSTKPVAFIGSAPKRENGSFLSGEVAQASLFGYDAFNGLPYVSSTTRIVSYMNAQGISIRAANSDQVAAARGIAQSMPAFPAEGSIRETDGYIVVKLGADDSYVAKYMAPEITQIQEGTQIVFDDTTRGSVNSCSLENGVLSISAWIMQPYYDSNYVVSTVYLWDEENQVLYTLNSGALPTPDLSTMFLENTDYSHCGVMGKAHLEQLPTGFENFKILLSVTTANGTHYLDPNVHLADLL